jgi:site-specific recombinase XerD
MKRFECPLLGYLEKQEIQALLKLPSRTTWTEQRDRLLWLLLDNTGARISEILALNRQDIQWAPSPAVQLHGKGRKQRLMPLLPRVAACLRSWLLGLPTPADTPVLPNRRGQRLSRFGAHKQLQRQLHKLHPQCPTMAGRKLSLHSLRHTAAMHLLQSGMDITVIAVNLLDHPPTSARASAASGVLR